MCFFFSFSKRFVDFRVWKYTYTKSLDAWVCCWCCALWSFSFQQSETIWWIYIWKASISFWFVWCLVFIWCNHIGFVFIYLFRSNRIKVVLRCLHFVSKFRYHFFSHPTHTHTHRQTTKQRKDVWMHIL